ncbi:MAG: hypothetical protein AB8F26_08315 [Phycisphaerales bacterium]
MIDTPGDPPSPGGGHGHDGSLLRIDVERFQLEPDAFADHLADLTPGSPPSTELEFQDPTPEPAFESSESDGSRPR